MITPVIVWSLPVLQSTTDDLGKGLGPFIVSGFIRVGVLTSQLQLDNVLKRAKCVCTRVYGSVRRHVMLAVLSMAAQSTYA